MITKLNPTEVIIIGTNSGGFHGAGAAGLAMRGDAKNNWRDDPAFLKAKAAPPDHPDRKGKWAVYGVARGHQIGTEGQSYAIETIVRPGLKRSTPLSEIRKQIMQMLTFADKHPELTLLATPIGCGLAGYSPTEMDKTWKEAIKNQGSLPKNLRNTDNLYQTNPEPALA